MTGPPPSAAAPGPEWFDIVDDRDRVVGRATRAEAHARRLPHRAVHVLVFNARGEVFLQKRSRSKDTSPGTWDSSASGHLDAGEEYDAAARRELAEEIGLAPQRPPERILRLEAGPDTGHEFVWVYRSRAEGPFTLAPAEIERGEWFAPAEVDRLLAARPGDFAGSFAAIWRRLAREPARAAWQGAPAP